MSNQIYKFVLKQGSNLDSKTINVPFGSKVLHVGAQGVNLCVWIEITPTELREDMHFVVAVTGEYLPANPMKYIGTVGFNDYAYVLHVYKLTT